MVEFSPDCSFVVLTLPHEDPLEQAHLWSEWTAAYPDRSPIEQGYWKHAVTALIEKDRIVRARVTLQTKTVRTAILEWERDEEDSVAYWLNRFNHHPPSALVGLLRSAAGCRWAIHYWSELARRLKDDGTWYGESRLGAIQLQGKSACVEHLYLSEEAFTTWIDCIACLPNPTQKDIDLVLDRKNIPKALLERQVKLWPRDPAECRARLQALVDRELPRLRALEETLRVQYEDPSRAEAKVMALAALTTEEIQLLRAEQIHEQSYQRAVTALLKARKQSAASRAEATRVRIEAGLRALPIGALGGAPDPASPGRDRTDVQTPLSGAVAGRSADRIVVGRPGRFGGGSSHDQGPGLKGVVPDSRSPGKTNSGWTRPRPRPSRAEQERERLLSQGATSWPRRGARVPR